MHRDLPGISLEMITHAQGPGAQQFSVIEGVEEPPDTDLGAFGQGKDRDRSLGPFIEVFALAR